MTDDDILAAELAAGHLRREDVRDADDLDVDPAASLAAGEQHGGQVRIAYRLASAYAGRLLHVHGLGWHTWDGTRWAEDENGEARRAVLAVLRDALTESLTDKQLRADVQRCESASGIEGVLAIAGNLHPLTASAADMDADAHLLNVANGVLNLDDLTLSPHDPALRMTKVTRGAYDPHADQSEWRAFLDRVLPDDDVRGYLQRLLGVALLGEVREHAFPIATGVGANGKGTTAETLLHTLGGYAVAIDPELLLASGRGPGGPELVELMGARLAIGSETNDGRAIDEALMKRLTGGDTLTARRLYRNPISWQPSHSLLYVTNHLPKVSGSSEAAWRRIRVVEFGVTIPEDERDPGLTARLRDSADAVLTWLVDGWRDYQRGGMRTPEAVQRATSAYRNENDDVARFVADALTVHPQVSARSSDLYAEWTRWAMEDGAAPLTQKAFGAELDRLGYPSRHTRAGRVRNGLGLAAHSAK